MMCGEHAMDFTCVGKRGGVCCGEDRSLGAALVVVEGDRDRRLSGTSVEVLSARLGAAWIAKDRTLPGREQAFSARTDRGLSSRERVGTGGVDRRLLPEKHGRTVVTGDPDRWVLSGECGRTVVTGDTDRRLLSGEHGRTVDNGDTDRWLLAGEAGTQRRLLAGGVVFISGGILRRLTTGATGTAVDDAAQDPVSMDSGTKCRPFGDEALPKLELDVAATVGTRRLLAGDVEIRTLPKDSHLVCKCFACVTLGECPVTCCMLATP